MADAPDNRLTDMSPDNHQPWLWFSHNFFFVCVISAGGLRFWIKRKYYGTSDIVLGVAHVRVDRARDSDMHLLILAWLAVLYFLLDHSAVCIDQWLGEIRSVGWSGSGNESIQS